MEPPAATFSFSSEHSRVASAILTVFLFLLPLFFIPSALAPFQFSKVMLALVAVVGIFLVFSVRTIRTGTLSMSWSWFSFTLLLLPLAYLISAVFSSVPSLSFFGYQLDQDTFGFMLLCFATSLATVLVATSLTQVGRVVAAFVVSSWIVLIFQAIQILFGTPMHFGGLFISPSQNLVGKWNDFGLYVSLIGALSVLLLEMVSHTFSRTLILSATLLASLLFLMVVNFQLAWILLGVLSFVTLIFSFMHMQNVHGGWNDRGIASFVTLVVVLFFLFFGSNFSLSLQNRFSISSLEVSPSFRGTLTVLQGVYAKNPFFGSGPNTFSNQWLLMRPQAVLGTYFWNTEFSAGFGYIPTALITGGIIVGLAWLFLICAFLYTATRALLTVHADTDRSYFLIVSSALGSAFLLVVHLFYVPSQVLTLLMFVFFGLFISSLSETASIWKLFVSFSQSPRFAFVSVVGIALALLASVVSLYQVSEVYASTVYENSAITRANTGDAVGALSDAKKAVNITPQDRYLRTLTTLQLAKLQALIQSGASDQSTQSQFQSYLSDAVTSSAAALVYDPVSFDNWMNRASVYGAVVPLQIQGAGENTITTLEQARKFNPDTPEIDYQEATVQAYAKETAGARKLAQAAIAKKTDYTPAILLLAQLAINDGNLNDAITSLKSAIIFNPNDPTLLYQLGLLELQAKQYQSASVTFAQALAITPNYANAQFFLGAADLFLGKPQDALTLFQNLQMQNPANTTLKDVIVKVEAGGNPFATSTPTLPDKTSTSAQ